MNVFFFEAFEEEAAALRRLLPPGIRADFSPDTVQRFDPAFPPAEAISVRTQSLIPAAWFGILKAILTRSTGYDHLLRQLPSTRARPSLGYLPLYCARAVAEQAFLLFLALARKLPTQLAQFLTFHRDGLTGIELQSKTLAVFGVGNIGYEAFKIGRGLGMEVLGVDIEQSHPDVTYVAPAEARARASMILCAMSLNPHNQGYFDAERLAEFAPGALFVNVSRGELSPSTALLDALNCGHLGGVGLDVFDDEAALAADLRDGQPAHGHPEVTAAKALAQHPRALLTPHNAFNTREAVERKAAQSMQQLAYLRDHGTFFWPVPQ